MIARLFNIDKGLKGGYKVTFETNDRESIERIQKLQDKDLNVEVKKKTKKRSLDANAYAWHLINEISNVLRVDKEEVYLYVLKHYGQSTLVSVDNAVDVSGFFKYYEPIFVAEKHTEYLVYKGSSEYDTREMSVLIDGIIQEAKELDIETMTFDEIERMKNLWRA